MLEILLQLLVSLSALAALLYGLAVRRHLLRLRRRAVDRYVTVDLWLVRRQDEVPVLIEAARPWPDAARRPLERLAHLRAGLDRTSPRAELTARVRLENELTAAFDTVLAALARDPERRARPAIAASRARLGELERKIAEDRCDFNEAIAAANAAMGGLVPGFVARLLGLEPMPMLVSPTETGRVPSPLRWR